MFLAVINARKIKTALIIILVFALCGGLTAKGLSVAVGTVNRLLPIYNVRTQEKKIAITFDAAWEDSDTDELIAILAEYNAHATFFIVGEWASRCSESVKKLYDAGHSIANHSDTHAAFSTLDKAGILSEIIACNDKLEAITGVKPQLLRAPSGDYDNKTIEAAQSLGMYTIQWSVDSLDYQGYTAQKITDRILSKTEPGAILLFHNGVKNTPDALRAILASLAATEYSFVTVEELIYKDDYTIDHTGTQIKNPQ